MPARLQPFVRRVLSRLATAETEEPDVWLRDDLRIARLTVLYAATGEAVLCSPHVLASYAVLGLHPEKVWPAIQARRIALCGPLFQAVAPPKKPAQSVKLWFEKTNAARAVNSRGAMQSSGEPATSVPMAAPSIAALYRNSDAPSSAKTRAYSLEELKRIVYYSGAPHSVRNGTLAALEARGAWPVYDGPATTILCVSLRGMMQDGGCCRRTAQRRVKRALALGFWRRTRNLNTWLDCPKCGTARTSAICPNEKCKHRGSSKDIREYVRPFTYELDVEKFIRAPRCREIHSVDWRTYAEYKAAAKLGEHPNVTEMPSRKPAQPSPEPTPPPATAAPLKRPAAEHEHRSPERAPQLQPKLTKRECAKFVADMAFCIRGQTGKVGLDGLRVNFAPGDPRYVAPMKWREALEAVCANWKRTPESVIEALKFWGYQLKE